MGNTLEGFIYIYKHNLELHQTQEKQVKAVVTQSCLTLCDPMDCNPPGSSVHGILQARILDWVALSFSRGSSPPRDQPASPALQANPLPSEPPGKKAPDM